MNCQQLQAFLATVERGSFRAAAEHHHISDSGLYRQVRKLEADLGVTLFESDSRNIRLTPIGRELIPATRAVLEAEEQLRLQARDLQEGKFGRVRIACFPMHIRCVLARAAVAFEAINPDTKIELIIASPENSSTAESLIRLLTVNEADVVLGPYSGPNVDSLALWKVRVVVAMADAHPLRRRKSISVSSLANERVFTLGPAVRSHQQLVQLYLDCGVDMTITGHGPADALIALAHEGLGCAVLGDDNLPAKQKDPFPWLRGKSGEPIEADMNLCWSSVSQVHPPTRKFVDFMRKNHRQLVTVASRST